MKKVRKNSCWDADVREAVTRAAKKDGRTYSSFLNHYATCMPGVEAELQSIRDEKRKDEPPDA